MAITSTGYQAPATARVGLKPSVYDKIILTGAEDTPILSKIGTSTVKNYEHAWIIDNLAAPKKNAQLEISDISGVEASTKQKRTNSVQIFTTEIMVSDSMKRIATYGGKELEYQVAKKAKEHKRDIEFALLGLGRDTNARTSVLKAPTLRTDTTAGEMAGLFYYVSQGETTWNTTGSYGTLGNVLSFGASKNWGTAAANTPSELTLEKLNIILQKIWDSGATPKDVFIGAELKAAINKMASRQFGNEKNVNSAVVSMDTDFGMVNFRLHRYLSAQYGLGDVLIAGDFSFMKHGLLTPTQIKDVPTSKTATVKRYYTESTLEVRNAEAFAIGVGLKA